MKVVVVLTMHLQWKYFYSHHGYITARVERNVGGFTNNERVSLCNRWKQLFFNIIITQTNYYCSSRWFALLQCHNDTLFCFRFCWLCFSWLVGNNFCFVFSASSYKTFLGKLQTIFFFFIWTITYFPRSFFSSVTNITFSLVGLQVQWFWFLVYVTSGIRLEMKLDYVRLLLEVVVC